MTYVREVDRKRSGSRKAGAPRPHLVSSRVEPRTPEIMINIDTHPDPSMELSLTNADMAAHVATPGVPTRAVPMEMPAAKAVAKRTLDVFGAIALALIFAPLTGVIILLLRRGGASVIYRHRRVGRNGQMFACLKFRTMVPNAEEVLKELLSANPELAAEWVRDHKLRDDPRVTRLGHFLRRTSLDELPQLWNVLRGEMSLVGPRPVVREELLRYGRSVSLYLIAKPGITGLWQVTGRNDTDYRRRVALDSYYVRNQNFLLDLCILTKKVGVVLGGNGAY